MTQRVRLADLDREADVVELPDGTEAKVKRLDGVMAHMWSEFIATPENERDSTILWDLAGRCLPDVNQEDVDRLTASQAGAVITVASGNVDRVLEILKNGNGAEMQAPNTSSPETPSAQLSVPSPDPPDSLPEPLP